MSEQFTWYNDWVFTRDHSKDKFGLDSWIVTGNLGDGTPFNVVFSGESIISKASDMQHPEHKYAKQVVEEDIVAMAKMQKGEQG